MRDAQAGAGVTVAPAADRLLAERRRRRVRRLAIAVVLCAMVVWSIDVTIIEDTDWERIGSLANVLEAAGEFVAVDWGLFPDLAGPALETFMIACLGTLLGVFVCIPVAWFGALNVTPFKPVTYPLARLMMTMSRSIHEIVWALFFVAVVGLGAMAGILALAMRSVGFIAKMSAEAIEDIDPGPVEAIRAVWGATDSRCCSTRSCRRSCHRSWGSSCSSGRSTFAARPFSGSSAPGGWGSCSSAR